jgi:hypothetical protein
MHAACDLKRLYEKYTNIMLGTVLRKNVTGSEVS